MTVDEMKEHSCEHCDEYDMVPGALAQRLKDERNQALIEVERLQARIKRLVAALRYK